MNKVLKRLLVFAIGIPVVLAIVFFNFYHHLLLNITICIAACLGANEFYNMLKPTKTLYSKPTILALSCLLPLLSYNFIIFEVSLELVPWIFVFEIFILMAIECFSQKEFSKSLEKISYSTLIIFYTGLLLTFLTRMTTWENSIPLLSLYFLLVFMCDSCAWLFGVCFGKNNRGYLAASPNKSIVGFFGGIAGSIATGCVFKLIFPELLYGSFAKIIIVAFGTSLASIIGDLIESVFKRSAGVKDSGVLIPGRGGLLDCLDSLLVAAPVFYIGVHYLYS